MHDACESGIIIFHDNFSLSCKRDIVLVSVLARVYSALFKLSWGAKSKGPENIEGIQQAEVRLVLIPILLQAVPLLLLRMLVPQWVEAFQNRLHQVTDISLDSTSSHDRRACEVRLRLRMPHPALVVSCSSR